jgi:hypothetical protein
LPEKLPYSSETQNETLSLVVYFGNRNTSTINKKNLDLCGWFKMKFDWNGYSGYEGAILIRKKL